MVNETSPIIIRPAKFDDALQLLPLMEQLGYPSLLSNLQDRIQLYSDPQYYQVLVAAKKDRIVGLIALVFYELFVFQGKRCRIEALVVDENHRSQGIGRHLMQEAETLAKQQDCRLIELTSGLRRAREGTHKFYISMGYDNDPLMGKLYLKKEL